MHGNPTKETQTQTPNEGTWVFGHPVVLGITLETIPFDQLWSPREWGLQHTNPQGLMLLRTAENRGTSACLQLFRGVYNSRTKVDELYALRNQTLAWTRAWNGSNR